MSLQDFEWGQTNNAIADDPLKRHGIIPSLDKLNKDLNKKFGKIEGDLVLTKAEVNKIIKESGNNTKQENEEQNDEIGHLANLLSQVLRSIYGEDEASKMISADKERIFQRNEQNQTWRQWFFNIMR